MPLVVRGVLTVVVGAILATMVYAAESPQVFAPMVLRLVPTVEELPTINPQPGIGTPTRAPMNTPTATTTPTPTGGPGLPTIVPRG
jgi:hypothetical protein